MENKTIAFLNTKMWYRLIKVVFVFLFLVSVSAATWVIFDNDMYRLDRDKTLIYCNGGDKRVLTANEAGVYFSNSDFIGGFDYKKYFEGYNDYTIRDIYRACYDKLPVDDVYEIQRIYEITGFKSNPKQYDEDYLESQVREMATGYKSNEQKNAYLDYSVHLFDIKPIYSHVEFIEKIITVNLIIVVFFELIRRSFYYIVLGSIKPKK